MSACVCEKESVGEREEPRVGRGEGGKEGEPGRRKGGKEGGREGRRGRGTSLSARRGRPRGRGRGRGSERGQSDLKGWGRPRDTVGAARRGQELLGTASGHSSGFQRGRCSPALSGRGLLRSAAGLGTRDSAARCCAAPPWPGALPGTGPPARSTGPRLGRRSSFPWTARAVRSAAAAALPSALPGRGSGRGSRDAVRGAQRR